ncbi:hypothetical protein AMATHDRAFT_140371 [Amanita thiersii Skay4041]|uniref:CASTOR ACT domain-containing protein n=1 Tax=Amanita thiersii Skay4041 TaxID=703135 RepID=A0A2A9NSE4_9AGAR|nr:hypothetical protein AMATHDRAFT_140371 [Amanita thiersii Skay4041]
MPPPSNRPSLHLQVLSEPFFVVQLQAGGELPPCILKDLTAGRGKFFSITRTDEEISLVGESYKWMPDDYKEQSTWSCIKITGPMEHSRLTNLTGILTEFTAPLKAAKVPLFALSTWNTDYVLVPSAMAKDAVNALEKDGWIFVQGKKDRTARL